MWDFSVLVLIAGGVMDEWDTVVGATGFSGTKYMLKHIRIASLFRNIKIIFAANRDNSNSFAHILSRMRACIFLVFLHPAPKLHIRWVDAHRLKTWENS